MRRTLLLIVNAVGMYLASGRDVMEDQLFSPATLISQELRYWPLPSRPPHTRLILNSPFNINSVVNLNSYLCSYIVGVARTSMVITSCQQLKERLLDKCPIFKYRLYLTSSRSSTHPSSLYLDTVATSGYPPVRRNVSPSSMRQDSLQNSTILFP